VDNSRLVIDPFTLATKPGETVLKDQPAWRQSEIRSALFRKGLWPWELTTLPKDLRKTLSGTTRPALTEVARLSTDNGDTIKIGFQTNDGAQVETVVMTYPGRATVCVSSQAGCAMGCLFCATGQAGFKRHLSTSEIVEQVVLAKRELRPRPLTHVVFMGMGEPLANYKEVLTAIRHLVTDSALSARRITVSTVGIIPGMRRLAAEKLPLTLALSLHAARNELRDQLVPMNRRYPIEELMEMVRSYRALTGRRVSFEWAMIDGVNDTDRDAAELADLARRAHAHVNLIPLNHTPKFPYPGSDPDTIENFRKFLLIKGITVTVRDTRGADIRAACGQLAAALAPS
jgi:23S rRNA (adenine2503-C2)-methyltransferase